MSRRVRLIWKTVVLTTAPVVAATALILSLRRSSETYVPGSDVEGVTRGLERSGPDSVPFRFTEVTHEAGVRVRHFPFTRTSQLPEDMASGLAWGDYDADGFPDLFVVNFAAPLGVPDDEMHRSDAHDRLFRNRGDGTFEDVTSAAGVGRAHRGMGAAWGDFDGDGDADLIVTSWGRNTLWENRGDGTFRDVTRSAGLSEEGFWAGASWADFDRDGDLDLYVCGYVRYIEEPPGSPAMTTGEADFPFTLNPSSYAAHENRLFVNRGDGTFEERAREAGVLGERGRSLSAAWTDLDQDGFLDLYVANDISDNLLYRNLGDGTFEDLSYPALVADYRGAMGVAVGDWDGDLDEDLFLTHWIAQENALYTNQLRDMGADGDGPRLFFGDDADRAGLGQISLDLIGWGTSFADFDLDGRLDLLVVNGSTFQERNDPTRLVPMHPHLYWNRGGDGFYEVSEAAGLRAARPGVGRGSAVADYDRDGDADIALLRHGEGVRLLRNDTPAGGSLGLVPGGGAAGAAAFGTRFLVYTADAVLLRESGTGAPYLSQDLPEVLVGLGSAPQADSVVVFWPDGGRSTHAGLAAGRLWRLLPDGSSATERRYGPLRPTAPAGAPPAAAARSGDRARRIRFWDLEEEASRAFADGEWAHAAALYDSLLSLDPAHEDARYNRGNALLELGRLGEALEEFRTLRRANPQAARAWVQEGLALLQAAAPTFDPAAAAEAFSRAHDLNRAESGPLELRGVALLLDGRAADAERDLSRAHRMNPQSPSAAYLAAYLAWKRGDGERARRLLEAARGARLAEAPAGGRTAEGDVRSDRLRSLQRRAAARRPFFACVADLSPMEPRSEAEAFACAEGVVARTRRRLNTPRAEPSPTARRPAGRGSRVRGPPSPRRWRFRRGE